MGLLSATKASPIDRHLVLFRPAGGLHAGQHVRLIGGPVPDWLEGAWTETAEPFPSNADAVFTVNVDAEQREIEEAARIFAPKPNPDLTRSDLWRRLPMTRDAAKFDLARTQYGFPALFRRRDVFGREIPVDLWHGREIDEWDERWRRALVELPELLGE